MNSNERKTDGVTTFQINALLKIPVIFPTFQLPASCCDDYEPGALKCPTASAYGIGCAEALYLMVDKKMVIVGVSVGGVLLIQLGIAICSCKVNGGFSNQVTPL